MTPPLQAPTRVVLVGFMGSGKSTVGRALAELLAWTFVDLDARIEERASATVPDIFERLGEAAFRELEREAAESLAEVRDVVVAAGGGAFHFDATRSALRRGGALSVWLRCDFETLMERVGAGEGRPLAGSRETMRALLRQREATYRLADRVEDTASSTPSEVAQRVACAVRGGVGGSAGRGGPCGI